MEELYSVSMSGANFMERIAGLNNAARYALSEFIERGECATAWIGKIEDPDPISYFPDAEYILEYIQGQDDFRGDEWESAFDYTREECNELANALRETFREWFAHHPLKVESWNVVDIHEYSEGELRALAAQAEENIGGGGKEDNA